MQTIRKEGIRGLYRGLTASYLGVTESTLQWMLYEQMKLSLAKREERVAASGRPPTAWDQTVALTGKVSAAGAAKFVAALITYPHEASQVIPLYLAINIVMKNVTDSNIGCPHSVKTSSATGWSAEIHRPRPMFPPHLEGGRHGSTLRRSRSPHVPRCTECCYYVRHL